MTLTSFYLRKHFSAFLPIFYLARAEGGRPKTFIHSSLETGQTEYLLIFWLLGGEVSVYLVSRWPGIHAFEFGEKIEGNKYVKVRQNILDCLQKCKNLQIFAASRGNIVSKSFIMHWSIISAILKCGEKQEY